MPTYKQVVNHVKKHVLWKDEYFERYYRLNPELVQKQHLEWTDFHNSDKRCCLTGYEIQRQDLLLWPFEYQAVKNWRARQGLSTPMIEHPLMNSPMTTANCPDFSQWQRPEWFNPLVDFLAQRRPELAFLRHLFI